MNTTSERTTIFGISIHCILVLIATIIAIRCNPKNYFIPLLAILFPEIYLIQFAVRKYLINDKRYCVGLS